jgi:FkbM family methyltransferase
MKIQVHPNDYDGRSLFFWGASDRKISWLCTELLRAGDTFLDIGANYGSVGLLAARRVGPRGHVHCFEPQPRLADCIRASVSLNGLTNVAVHELALSDRNGTFPLTVPQGHSGRASLCADVGDGTSMLVPVRHAGEYLTSLGLSRIRVIKLDVESHEEAVLRGATDFLKQTKPLAIVFESHDDGKPLLSRGLVRLLRALGYDIFQIRQRPMFRVQLKALRTPDDVETGYDFIACDALRTGKELTSVCSVV